MFSTHYTLPDKVAKASTPKIADILDIDVTPAPADKDACSKFIQQIHQWMSSDLPEDYRLGSYAEDKGVVEIAIEDRQSGVTTIAVINGWSPLFKPQENMFLPPGTTVQAASAIATRAVKAQYCTCGCAPALRILGAKIGSLLANPRNWSGEIPETATVAFFAERNPDTATGANAEGCEEQNQMSEGCAGCDKNSHVEPL